MPTLFWRHRTLLLTVMAAVILTMLMHPVLRATDAFEPTSIGASVAIAGVVAILSIPALALHAAWPHVIAQRRGSRARTRAAWVAAVGGAFCIAGLIFAIIEAPYLGAPRIGAAIVSALILAWNAFELVRARPGDRRIPRSRVLWSGGASLLLGAALGLVLG